MAEATSILASTNGDHLLDAEPFKQVSIVARHAITELEHEHDPKRHHVEPLRWSLHGGPGTGKPRALRVINEQVSEEVLPWDMGIELRTVALQSAMADLFDGDTIHHALGISCFGRTTNINTEDLLTRQEVGKRVFRWRWHIIDEICMVSARLLAEVDVKLINLVISNGAYIQHAQGHVRCFCRACINGWRRLAITSLPKAGFLGDTPFEYMGVSETRC